VIALETGRPDPGRSRNGALVVVEELRKYFPIRRGVLGRTAGQVRAVDGVSFDVFRG
jgi:peptide/nickel transport system ATP-binding protein